MPHIGTGQIISISRSPSFTDLTLKQEEANLVFWFRSPLSVKHAILAWYVPNVFTDSNRVTSSIPMTARISRSTSMEKKARAYIISGLAQHWHGSCAWSVPPNWKAIMISIARWYFSPRASFWA